MSEENKKYGCYFYDNGCCLSYPHMIALFKKECDQKFNQHRCLFYKENKNLVPTDGGELKSVSSKEDTQRKPKKIASGKISAGHKEVSARTSESKTI